MLPTDCVKSNVEWFYRRLILLYPADFRHEYDHEMLADFREEWAEARRGGWQAAGSFWIRLLRDWAVSVVRAHSQIVGQDLTAASRSLRHRPLSAIISVLLLAIVIAVNTFAFIFADRVILRPLPFERNGRLVFLSELTSGGADWQVIPRTLAERLEQTSHTLQDIAFVTAFSTNVEGRATQGYFVTPATFKNLGFSPRLGRLFEEGERDVALLSYEIWRDRFHYDSSVLGSEMKIFDRKYRVVGVLDEEPTFPFAGDVWASMPETGMYGSIFARLRPGVSRHEAEAEWMEMEREQGGYWPARLSWLRRANRRPVVDLMVWLIQAAFLVVFLLACGNLTLLQFGWHARRHQEVAVRMSVGASRRRLLRLLLTESMSMAVLSAAVSLPFTVGMIAAIHAALDWWGKPSLGGWSSVQFDGLAVAAAICLGLMSGLLAGIVPAWRLARHEPWAMFAPWRWGRPFWQNRLCFLILAAQMTLAMPLLFFAIAFTTEARSRMDSPTVLYFNSALSATFNLSEMCSEPRGCSQDHLVTVIEKLSDALRRKGQDLIVTDSLPFASNPGPLEYEAGSRHLAQVIHVNAAFFRIAGFRWRYGHAWQEEGLCRNVSHRIAVVVNRELAEQAGHMDGSIILFNRDGRQVPVDIAGVAEQPPLDLYGRPKPTIFVPYQCASLANTKLLVVPTGNAAIEQQEIIAQSREIDPTVKLKIQDYGSQVRTRFSLGWQTMEALFWLAGLASLGLAFTGITAYLVQFFAERRYQTMVRCAMGARSPNIWMWVTRQAVPALASGTALGAALELLALWLPPEIAPRHSLGLWAAGATAPLVLWVGSALTAGLASRRAARAPLTGYLRHE